MVEMTKLPSSLGEATFPKFLILNFSLICKEAVLIVYKR